MFNGTELRQSWANLASTVGVAKGQNSQSQYQ